MVQYLTILSTCQQVDQGVHALHGAAEQHAADGGVRLAAGRQGLPAHRRPRSVEERWSDTHKICTIALCHFVVLVLICTMCYEFQ